MKNSNLIDCYQCKHFYVTWEPANPKGCRAFGFKTAKMPSLVVFETSGDRCLKFEMKEAFKQKRPQRPSKKTGWTA